MKMTTTLLIIILASGMFSGSAWATARNGGKRAQTDREGTNRGLYVSIAEMRAELDPGLRLLNSSPEPGQNTAEQLEAARAMLDAVAIHAADHGTGVMDEAPDELEHVPVHLKISQPKLARK